MHVERWAQRIGHCCNAILHFSSVGGSLDDVAVVPRRIRLRHHQARWSWSRTFWAHPPSSAPFGASGGLAWVPKDAECAVAGAALARLTSSFCEPTGRIVAHPMAILTFEVNRRSQTLWYAGGESGAFCADNFNSERRGRNAANWALRCHYFDVFWFPWFLKCLP